MTEAAKIKVLVVDDSAVVRGLLSRAINSQPDMTVIAVASDPIAAIERLKASTPDVLTLDVEMPRMDGLQFLEKLMRIRPLPVVMVSSLTARGAEVTMRALELGAVDFVAKPSAGDAESLAALHLEADLFERPERLRATSQPADPAHHRMARVSLPGLLPDSVLL